MMTPFEKYMTYLKGMTAGFACKALDPKFTEHPKKMFRDLYNEGWIYGSGLRTKERKKIQKRFDYTPSPLRINENAETSI